MNFFVILEYIYGKEMNGTSIPFYHYMEREKLNSRIGFILLSAGCAIGIGNVWRFPYVAGRYGGGIFVLFYLFFLVIMGIPVMTMEFAVGRASRKSIIRSFHEMEKPGQKWHLQGYLGNSVLYLYDFCRLFHHSGCF